MDSKRITWLTSVGVGMEYYDFITYAMLATYLSQLFFPQAQPSLQLIATFTVFAIGYLIRPIGGILFGVMGDRWGRKKVFFIVMLLMAFATFGIGILPTYESIGLLAPLLLTFFRLLQGLSFGAEIPGAITVISEYAEAKSRGTHCSFVVSGTCIGSIASSAMLYMLTQTFSPEAVLSWGWRIPFLIGGALAIVSYYIRLKIHETPEYEAAKPYIKYQSLSDPLRELFNHSYLEVIVGTGITIFSSCMVIVNLYFPVYFSKHYGYSMHSIYLAMTLGLVWAALLLPAFGRLSDKLGRRRFLMLASAGFAVSGIWLFKLAGLGESYLIPFTLCYQTFIAALLTGGFPLLAELFPTKVRYTGIATCYNITHSIAGLSPVFITMMTDYTGAVDFVVWFLMGLAILTVTMVRYLEMMIRNGLINPPIWHSQVA